MKLSPSNLRSSFPLPHPERHPFLPLAFPMDDIYSVDLEDDEEDSEYYYVILDPDKPGVLSDQCVCPLPPSAILPPSSLVR